MNENLLSEYVYWLSSLKYMTPYTDDDDDVLPTISCVDNAIFVLKKLCEYLDIEILEYLTINVSPNGSINLHFDRNELLVSVGVGSKRINYFTIKYLHSTGKDYNTITEDIIKEIAKIIKNFLFYNNDDKEQIKQTSDLFDEIREH